MKPRLLWVFARDAHGMTAALVRDEARGQLALVEWQRSETSIGDAACETWIDDAITGSRTAGVRDAIVVTGDAKAAIVHLPSASAQQLRQSEMHEMIGWELEPLLPAGDDPRVACAWVEPANGRDAGRLASGIRVDRLEWWKRVLSHRGLRLRGLLPAAGVTIANVPATSAGRRAVVEVGREELTCVVLSGSRVGAVDTYPLRRDELPLRVLSEVLTDDVVDEVLISSRGEVVDCGESGRLACAPLDPRCIDESGADDLGGGAAWVAAAARTYLDSSSELAVLPLIPARVSAADSGRWRNARRLLAAVALVAAVGAAEMWIRTSEAAARSALVEAQAPLVEQRRLRGRFQASGARSEALRTEAATLRQRAEALGERLDRIGSFGPRRDRILPALLESLACSVTSVAVVERLVEQAPGVVCVSCRARSEHAVQRLTRDLAEALRPLDLRVTKQEIRQLVTPTDNLSFSYVLVLAAQDGGDA